MPRSMKGYIMPKNGEYILRDGWYWPESECAQGHKAPRNKFKQCVQCVRDYRKKVGHYTATESSKKWRKDNKDYLNKIRLEYSRLHPKKKMVSAAKKSAKNKGLPFNLSEMDFEIPDKCPVLGFELVIGVGRRTDASPSLDRIIPEMGYVKGNVLVVSWRANRLKQDASLDEMEAIFKFYRNIIASKD